MTVSELLEQFERRKADAARHGATAPVAKVYEIVLEELRAVAGSTDPARLVTTAEAAQSLSVSTKTVRRWLDAGRFPNAIKTAQNGEWRIPASDVYALSGRRAQRSGVTRLWSPK